MTDLTANQAGRGIKGKIQWCCFIFNLASWLSGANGNFLS